MKRQQPERYQDIPIPDALGDVIDRAAARAKHQRRRRPLVRTGICAAAALCVLTVTANSPLAAQAVHIPVLGTVVQMLHIGSGGVQTDGLAVHAAGEGSKADILFTETEGSADFAPSYTAKTYRAPGRVVLSLGGVRLADRQAVCDTLTQTEGVRDAYFAMVLDDSAMQLVIELEPGYTYEITERAEPAGLTFTFTKDDTQTDFAPVYYLRTEAMPYGESLGIAAERFWGKETTQVRTEEGNYIVTVGEYQSESEAQSALDALNAELGETGLTIASSLPDERPHDAE